MHPDESNRPAAEDADRHAPTAPAAGESSEASAEGAPAHAADDRKSRSSWKRNKATDHHAGELARHKDEAAKEWAAIQDRLLRLQADFDNYRKRTQREKAELIRAANEDMLAELLPVIDHFELALDAAGDKSATDALIAGVRMVREQLLAVLARFGLQPVDASGAFDPTRHEAISHLPSDSVPENNIMTQTRRGYQLGERMLRPAQVVVSSGPATPAAEG